VLKKIYKGRFRTNVYDVGRRARRDIPIPTLFIAGAALLGLNIATSSMPVFVLPALAIGAALVWSARIEVLPLLLVMHLAPRDFFAEGAGLEPSSVFNESIIQYLKIWIILVACVRVIYGFCIRERALIQSDRRGIEVWIACLLLGFAASAWGKWSGFENWSRAARFAAASGLFFYGLIVAGKRGNFDAFSITIFSMAVCLIGLAASQLFAQHLLFLFVGPAVTLGLTYFRSRSLVMRTIGIIAIVVSVIFVVGQTFTFQLIVIVAACISLAWWSPLRRSLILLRSAFAILIMFPVVIVMWTLYANQRTQENVSSNNPLIERINDKMLMDRGPVWTAAYRQILDGPYFVVPSGRALILDGGRLVQVEGSSELTSEWTVGAHNVVLETYRNGGLVLGTLCIGLMAWHLRRIFKASQNFRTSGGSLAVGLFAVAIVGAATGDFPLDSNVSFCLWVTGGLCCGAQREERWVSSVERQGLSSRAALP
jgi:hypothetical protein